MGYYSKEYTNQENMVFYKACNQSLQTFEANQRHIWFDAQKDQKSYNQSEDKESNAEDQDP